MLITEAQPIQNGHVAETDTIDHVQSPPSPPRVKVTCGALTHQGKVRNNNEDHFLVARLAKSMQICRSSLKNTGETKFSDDDGYLMIVAGRMGEAADGELAGPLADVSLQDRARHPLP